MTDLVVDDVTIRYGATAAIDRFSLTVDSGEIIAVLGPSGSGKSTLLRAVAGLEPLAGGRITLGGTDLASVPTHRRGLGLMFQDHGLFAHLTVADNIAYGLQIAGQDAPTRHRRVEELLALTGLQGFGARSVDQLSGGEAQRVALARALAPEPGLLMLDEPLGSLDRALRDQLTGDLRRLLTEIGQTALHVTHDQAEAFAVADRVVVVADGRPVIAGSPAEVWADPGSVFVARFLGHRNIWSVTVDDEGAVRRGRHRIGMVERGHPLRSGGVGGERIVVVPATAIRARPADDSTGTDAAPGLPGRIVMSVFRQGIHDVTATLTGTADEVAHAGLADSESVHYMTTEVVDPGTEVMLTVDCQAVRPLVDHGPADRNRRSAVPTRRAAPNRSARRPGQPDDPKDLLSNHEP